ncbi:unnamed protein product [Rhizopus stolonifer]
MVKSQQITTTTCCHCSFLISDEQSIIDNSQWNDNYIKLPYRSFKNEYVLIPMTNSKRLSKLPSLGFWLSKLILNISQIDNNKHEMNFIKSNTNGLYVSVKADSKRECNTYDRTLCCVRAGFCCARI